MDRPQHGRYILREQHIAHRKTKGLLSRHKNQEPTSVLPGSLWADHYDKKSTKSEKIGFSYFISLEFENLILSCPPKDVAYLSPVEYELLAPVPVHGDRIRILEDRDWMREGISLRPGDFVHIVKHVNLPDHSTAVVRYKGHLEGKVGIYFGLELMGEHRGKGFTNGTIFNARYFHCDPNCGIFCTLARVRRHPSPDDPATSPSPLTTLPHSRSHPGSPSVDRFGGTDRNFYHQDRNFRPEDRNFREERNFREDAGRNLNRIGGGGSDPRYAVMDRGNFNGNGTTNTTMRVPLGNSAGMVAQHRRERQLDLDENGEYPLSFNERVVWLGDAGPEFGTVRWIGRLPDSQYDEITVGVEFDRPVGSGTGKYKDAQLFKTKPNHASLIPMIGLMKEDEYINPTPVKMPIDFEDRPPRHIRRMRQARAAAAKAAAEPPEEILDDDEGEYSSVIKRLTPRADPTLDSAPETWVRRHPAPAGANSRLQLSTFKPLEPDEVPSPGASKLPIRPGPVCDTSRYNVSTLTNLTRVEPMGNGGAGSSDSSRETAEPRPLGPRVDRPEPGLRGPPDPPRGPTDPMRAPADPMRPELRETSAEGRAVGNRLADVARQNDVYASVNCKSKTSPEVSTTVITSKTKKQISFNESDHSPTPPRVKSPTQGAPQSVLKRPLNPVHEMTNHVDDADGEERSATCDVILRGPMHRNHSNNAIPSSVPSGLSNSSCLSDISDSTTSSPADQMLNNTKITQAQIELPPSTRHLICEIEIGDMVEVLQMPVKYGVVRWIGVLPESKDPNRTILGLEMEEEHSDYTDGTFNGRRIFHCPPNKGFFAYLNKVAKDTRFVERTRGPKSGEFGSTESPDIPGNVAPPSTAKELTRMYGRFKGIQGHHNSCYLDATLFSMFAFSQVFDTILHRPRNNDDIEEFDTVQKVLKESIVNPLRRNHFVRADKVLHLRELLDRLGTVSGLTTEEKDPEEFLNSLLQDTLRCEPFIKLNSGQESMMYQLIIEKDERWIVPTTQQLLGLSFLQSNIKLAEIPPCLIIQMPRFGKDFKMYPRIVPSLTLDITDLLLMGPRECIICGKLATYECRSCYRQFGDSLDKIAFCDNCQKSSHEHPSRCDHQPSQLEVPPEYKSFLHEQTQMLGPDNVRIHRETMELFAILCIQTSHYVAFVKCGSGAGGSWVFFDSMADRRGEEHGYNIPEVTPCPDLDDWLQDNHHDLIIGTKEDRQLPTFVRRALCDAYMCFYQNPEVMMYK